MSAAPLPPLLLVGCGRMGSALLAGWRRAGVSAVVAVDPARPAGVEGEVRYVSRPEEIDAGLHPAAVILAIKPQEAEAVLPAYRRFTESAFFLSIMAGRRIAGIAEALGRSARVIRAMPNTPASIGKGVSVACPGPGVGEAERALATRLLGAVGKVAWVEDEALLDPVTAVSGSGPAYVFLLAELLEAAGRAQGLPPDLARLLARHTVAGSGALLEASSEEASALRAAVTSKGGTTAAALAVLMEEGAWPRLVQEAVAAATRRSRELAG